VKKRGKAQEVYQDDEVEKSRRIFIASARQSKPRHLLQIWSM